MIELTALAILAPIFLLYAPRSGALYIGMALLFLAYIRVARERNEKQDLRTSVDTGQAVQSTADKRV